MPTRTSIPVREAPRAWASTVATETLLDPDALAPARVHGPNEMGDHTRRTESQSRLRIADGHSVYFVEVMTSYVRIDDGLGDVHRMTMLEVRKTFCVDLRGAHFLWCGRGWEGWGACQNSRE